MAYKNGLRGTHADDTYGQQMIGMVGTLANEAAVDNVVAYITSLPDEAPEKTIEGDLGEGKRLYTVCAYCHGDDGMGIEALNAPRLAGMTDWYIERQLVNFKEDVRGSHPQDYYGFQMGLMGKSLHTEQAMKDIVAYINTL